MIKYAIFTHCKKSMINAILKRALTHSKVSKTPRMFSISASRLAHHYAKCMLEKKY